MVYAFAKIPTRNELTLKGTEENFIKENSSLGEGLIIGTAAWRKEFTHHQERPSREGAGVCPSPSPPGLQSPDGFPLSGTTKRRRGEETGDLAMKVTLLDLNRPKRESVFRKGS